MTIHESAEMSQAYTRISTWWKKEKSLSENRSKVIEKSQKILVVIERYIFHKGADEERI